MDGLLMYQNHRKILAHYLTTFLMLANMRMTIYNNTTHKMVRFTTLNFDIFNIFAAMIFKK